MKIFSDLNKDNLKKLEGKVVDIGSGWKGTIRFSSVYGGYKFKIENKKYPVHLDIFVDMEEHTVMGQGIFTTIPRGFKGKVSKAATFAETQPFNPAKDLDILLDIITDKSKVHYKKFKKVLEKKDWDYEELESKNSNPGFNPQVKWIESRYL